MVTGGSSLMFATHSHISKRSCLTEQLIIHFCSTPSLLLQHCIVGGWIGEKIRAQATITIDVCRS
jgi:hypothetical protein